jgi:hypothetical protein
MFSCGRKLRVGALLLVVPLAVLAVDARQVARNQWQPGLRATVTVVSQSYCVNPEEMQSGENDRFGSVGFLLNLRVENTKDHTVILCRDCIEVGSEPVLLSVSPDGSPGSGPYGGMMYDGVFPRKRRHDPASPDHHYVILKTRGTFDGSYKIGILVSYGSPATPRMILKSGRYSLRVEFRTWWPEAIDTTDLLRGRWKRYGDLYAKPLFPDPVPVQIEIPNPLPTCPNN